nr:MAG TPA: minor tail protein [Caudoviricetes sp.]
MAENVELQGLEFKISNDSASAESGISRLKTALENLKSATQGGTTGLKNTAKGIAAISNAVKGLDVSQKLSNLADSLSKLNGIRDLKISASIGNQLSAISTAVNSVQDTSGSKLEALANGLRPLSELGKSQMGSFINQLKKLPEVISELDKADIGKFADQMARLSAAMKPFADEMQKVSAGFSSFPSRIQKVISSSDQYNNAMKKATTQTNGFGLAIKGLKFATLLYAFRKVASFLGYAITNAGEYQEDLNLFTVSMGEYAEEAYRYAQQVSEVMGIDPAEWMRNQGVFNTIISGFGVVGDKAAFMSKNLTQLGYDIASFYNISFSDAMQKVQSGIAGELEPLRRLGYDLSVARLQQEALNLGITKSVSAMTQAEKAQLRYYAMMTQVTQVQGDMARTLENPTNMLRVLKAQLEQVARAIGNLFIPILTKVLPVLIAFVKALREIIAAIAALFGVTLEEPEWKNGFSNAAMGSGDIADNLSDATDSAKELKRYLAGFDELNVLPDQTKSASGGGIGGIGGGDLGIDLPGYDFLANAVSKNIDMWQKKFEPFVNFVKENLKDILATVTSIGAGILAWKVSKDFLTALKMLKDLRPKNLKFSIDFPVLGLSMFLADMREFERYLRDFMDNGATFQNVAGMISEFSGMVGDAFIVLGNVKLGGALKVVQGIGEIVASVEDISENGVNWDNALTAIRGLTDIAIGIEVLTGNIKAAGWTVAIQGLTTVVRELADNWDAIKRLDFSGVDKVTLIVGALEVLGGLAVALDWFSKLKGITNAGESVTAVQQVTEATSGLETATGNLSPKLSGLAKNLGLGVVVMAEVAAGAIIFVGAIAILGWELGKVKDAWQPVIDNAGTVAIAVGVGAGLLTVIGVACYALGSLGGAVALNIGIGTLILLELGVAAALFLAEIWGIGKALDEIGQAWQPVLDNGETIATGIGLGTALLVGIGVVTAALGVATVATAGLLPVAIGLGTAILVELAVAFVAFTESLIAVADEINNNLSPALSRLNPKLPVLKSDMYDFTVYMTDFAEAVSLYTKSMGKVTWDSIVTGFQRLFARNPIGSLANDVNGIYTDVSTLNAKLTLANPELVLAVQLMTSYVDLMNQLQVLVQKGHDASGLPSDMFTNMRNVGTNLVTGFVAGIDSMRISLSDRISSITLSISNSFANAANSACYSIQRIIRQLMEIPGSFGISMEVSAYGSGIQAYADGGFVDEGQLFIAREAGTEMVGSIGRRTAVANNDQIVEGITYGVREANDDVVTAIYAVAQQIIGAMQEQNNGNGRFDLGAYIARQQRETARMNG